MADETNAAPGLHELRPAEGSHRNRKRVGRGEGSGTGKTSGRGQKGQKSRSGSHRMRAGFEGGQMPLYMRLGKLRGPNHRKSMPMGPFRTYTTPVNVGALERFDAGVEVTPDLLKAAGVLSSLRHPVKILGDGELSTKLTVHAHAFSRRAAEAIEAAGGKAVVIGGGPAAAEPEEPRRGAKAKAAPAEEPAAEAQDEAPEADAEPETETEE
jgi:large subunit ribosomal protein L15